LTSALPRARRSHSFFFTDTATTEIYTLSLHDAIPKLRLILILNSFLGSSDSLVFSELFHSLAPRPLAARSRSEERRVGKECRSRWSPHDEQKKSMVVSRSGRLPRNKRRRTIMRR